MTQKDGLSPDFLAEMLEISWMDVPLASTLFIVLAESESPLAVSELQSRSSEKNLTSSVPTIEQIQTVLDEYARVGAAVEQEGLYTLTELGMAHNMMIQKGTQKNRENVMAQKIIEKSELVKPNFKMIENALEGEWGSVIRYIVTTIVDQYSPLMARIDDLVNRDFSKEDLEEGVKTLQKAGIVVVVSAFEEQMFGIPPQFHYLTEFKALFG